LADFQAHLEELTGLGASVYALSTDSTEHARGTVKELGLTFPVLYGMDGPATAGLLGAYYEKRRILIQPANFLIAPDRTIAAVSYASGPIGRFVAEDTVRFITFLQKKAADAAAKSAEAAAGK